MNAVESVRRIITEKMAGELMRRGIERGVYERHDALLAPGPCGKITGDALGSMLVGKHGREYGLCLAKKLSLPGHLHVLARALEIPHTLAEKIYDASRIEKQPARDIAQKLEEGKF